ncbi:helix-turn-helix domain-containing protein [uncultured Roseobacter sp.]|uniref:helix-turn-helix domain-containing protein n=1 Tax=uncultured Roseobacter sp. TaxID=114847 RepID=UPI00261D52E4|nr:helix-turn-helix domain-containing protein [uncultured Roseobacter sp.]
MLDTNLLFVVFQTTGFSAACIAFALCLVQWRHGSAYGMLGLMFLALATSELSVMFEIIVTDPPQAPRDVLRMISYFSTFFIAPLFLFYVRLLTGSDTVCAPRAFWFHMALPALSFIATAGFLTLPADIRGLIFDGAAFDTLSGAGKTFALALVAVEFLIYCQWLIYVPWVLRVQMQHKARLRDLFASTEAFETRWVIGMALFLGFYAALCFVDFGSRLIYDAALLGRLTDTLMVMIIVLILMLWGLRQSPGLHGPREAVHQATTAPHPKYERSALADTHADRIERKLRRAMEQDHLYRDPNLSLWTLSQHIGASTNYVSQTLNERVGQSFFDYVNGWRIEEAKPLIRRGEQTVLAIAYEVGFNSRSSFYAAFRKQTGVTPSTYKSTPGAAQAMLG